MTGAISLSLEREPDYFAGGGGNGESRETIVAREDGRLICVGSCHKRRRFINGEARTVGYLGGLRLDQVAAGRFDVVRRGYGFFRDLQREAPADLYFTSVAADNHRARRLLERNLPGMPRYEEIAEFVTLMIPVPSPGFNPGRIACEWNEEIATTGHQYATRLNAFNQRYQLSPVWTDDQLADLENLGLRRSDFVSIEKAHESVGAALWDQRGFKQTVIRGYTRWLALARPILNLSGWLTGGPRLPAVGTVLANGVVSFLTGDDSDGGGRMLIELFHSLRMRAVRRRLDWITAGFSSNDPRLATVQNHFRCREYRSRLYLVHWPDIGLSASELDGRIIAPEVALL